MSGIITKTMSRDPESRDPKVDEMLHTRERPENDQGSRRRVADSYTYL